MRQEQLLNFFGILNELSNKNKIKIVEVQGGVGQIIKRQMQKWAKSFEERYHEPILDAAVRHFDYQSNPYGRKLLEDCQEMLAGLSTN